jgi:integrase
MSIQKTCTGACAVRWREGGRMRSQTFRLKRDAERFDLKIKDAKQTGTLSSLDGGRETLDEYVENTWAPIHAAALAAKTQALYAGLYDGHVSPTLGGYQLRELTPEVIGRWQADRLNAGARAESTRKALTLLGGILQRAVEAGRIGSNPQRLVRKAAPAATEGVRPLAPATVEAIRALLRPRDATFISLLAYAGLRPQEARALLWAHVQERTLVVHAPKTRRHSTQPRSVRLLAPLAQDLREWRLLSGRPGGDLPVIPAMDTHARPSRTVWSGGRLRAVDHSRLGARARKGRARLPAPV